MLIWRVLLLAAAHFFLLFTTAVIAHGWDLDHVSSRTTVTAASGALHAVLMLPLEAVVRALPGALPSWVQPLGLLVANSLLWGVALYGLWRLPRIARARV